jgi:ATP-dependent helicase STH1/SNF2
MESLSLQNFHVVITTHELFHSDINCFLDIDWEFLVFDEGRKVKGDPMKIVSATEDEVSCKQKILLLNSSLPDTSSELWSILNFLFPQVFLTSLDLPHWFLEPLFRQGYIDENEFSELDQLTSDSIGRRLESLIKPFTLRRLKKDLDFRPSLTTDRVIVCPMSGMQKAMDAALSQERIALSSRPLHKRKVLNSPFLTHPVFLGSQPSQSSFSSDLRNLVSCCGKMHILDWILHQLKAAHHRVLIFFQMNKAMDIMEEYLRLRKYFFVRIDGSTSSESRTQLLDRFNSDESVFVFLLSSKAGGFVLNSANADTVILYDLDSASQSDLSVLQRQSCKDYLTLRLVTADSVESASIQSKGNDNDLVVVNLVPVIKRQEIRKYVIYDLYFYSEPLEF